MRKFNIVAGILGIVVMELAAIAHNIDGIALSAAIGAVVAIVTRQVTQKSDSHSSPPPPKGGAGD